MRIKLLRSLGSGWPALTEGNEADVEDAMGEKLVAAGLAERISAQSPDSLKAVPPAAQLRTDVVKSDSEIVGTDAALSAVATEADNDEGTPAEKLNRRQRRQREAETTTQ